MEFIAACDVYLQEGCIALHEIRLALHNVFLNVAGHCA
jgi:hypothetical protein